MNGVLTYIYFFMNIHISTLMQDIDLWNIF